MSTETKHRHGPSPSHMRLLIGFAMLLCLPTSVEAQISHTVKGPRAAEQRELRDQVEANLVEYEKHMPNFVCQPLWRLSDSDVQQAGSELPKIVIADLEPSERDAPSTAVNFSVAPLIRDLFSEKAKFTFVRWAKVRRKSMAVYHYKKKSRGGVREADIYADEESGMVSRILFQDVETPDDMPLACRTAPE